MIAEVATGRRLPEHQKRRTDIVMENNPYNTPITTLEETQNCIDGNIRYMTSDTSNT